MAGQALRAVVLRRKKWLIIESDEGGENGDAFPSQLRTRLGWDDSVDAGIVHSPMDEDSQMMQLLAAEGFDFSKPALVEFSVGFRAWPPRHEALRRLLKEFPSALVMDVENDSDGCVEFQVYALVTRQLIENIRGHVAELLAPYRGTCSSWDVVDRRKAGG